MSNKDTVATGALDSLLGDLKSKVAPFRATLNDLYAKHRDNHDGKVADYIPELALAETAKTSPYFLSPIGENAICWLACTMVSLPFVGVTS